jgi:hypothetical protein
VDARQLYLDLGLFRHDLLLSISMWYWTSYSPLHLR